MFEKEAKEYANENKICLVDIDDKELLEEGFKDGAEFGYNKCKEELNHKGLALQSDMDKTIEQNIALKKELNKANEWHYTKYKLPPDGVPLLCMRGGNVYVAWFILGKWKGDKYNDVKKPYAWKEITLPEEG